MAQSLEDRGLFRSPRIYDVPIHGVSLFGPSSHNTLPVFEVSGVPLLAKVAGSRGGLAHALDSRAGGPPETTAYS